MGILKDFLSGSLPSQNSGQSRDTRSPSPPTQEMPPTPSSRTSPPLSPSERARAKYEEGLRFFDGVHMAQGIEAFIAATEIDPNCVDAWCALAKCYDAMDPIKFADNIMLCAENALRADPSNQKSKKLGATAYARKGEVAINAGDWDEAYYYVKRAYKLEPEDQDLLDAFAYAAEKTGKFQEVAQQLRARLAEKPDDEHARYILGRTLTKMSIEEPLGSESRTKMFSEAEAHLTKFLSNDPLSPEANYFLGFVYVGQGRMDLAGEIVAKLADIDIERSKDLAEVVTS